MKRNIEEKLNEWILKDTKSALLIEGARQVGKTYSIRKALKDNNISSFEINFIERPDILNALKNIDDIDELIAKIELYSQTPLKKGKSIIFFDEVQVFPEIVTKIKFLVNEGRYRYILSGSLLGVELKGIKSVPVGYMKTLKMYPMNFEEFLYALEVKKETIDHIHDCFNSCKEVDELIHNKMMRLFYTYLIVGGMPASINKFLETKNLYDVDKEQKGIINSYKADFSKYESDDRKLRIISIYDNIPSQLNKQNQRFIFTYLNKEIKFDRYENSFLWLKDAGVAYPVYIAKEAKTPLVISKDKNLFKLFLSDVGLLTSCYPFSVREEIISNANNDFNNGALFENYAAQELYANNLIPYYYRSTDIGEIDFMVEIDSKVVPIEIKSGKEYKAHKALDNLMKKYPNSIQNPIVFSPYNVLLKEGINYFPIYMIGFLKNKEARSYEIKIDIENL